MDPPGSRPGTGSIDRTIRGRDARDDSGRPARIIPATVGNAGLVRVKLPGSGPGRPTSCGATRRRPRLPRERVATQTPRGRGASGRTIEASPRPHRTPVRRWPDAGRSSPVDTQPQERERMKHSASPGEDQPVKVVENGEGGRRGAGLPQRGTQRHTATDTPATSSRGGRCPSLARPAPSAVVAHGVGEHGGPAARPARVVRHGPRRRRHRTTG